jgi:hypothetical protein
VTLTLRYSAIARNLAPADLATRLGAVPLDTDTAALLGLTLASDTAASAGNVATRTIVYTTAPTIIPDADIAETFVNYYTVTFSKALATPVTAAAPVLS